MNQRDKIIAALRKKLDKTGWNRYMWIYWTSTEWVAIIDALIKEVEEGRRWAPGVSSMLRFMEECPLDQLKAVMVVDRVSVVWEDYDGIPLSYKNKAQPAKYCMNIQQTLPEWTEDKGYITDMAVWANQGVLMIPTAMTVEIGKEGHYNMWTPFISYLLEYLNRDYKHLPYVFIGTRAIKYSRKIRAGKKIHLQFKDLEEWKSMWIEVNKQVRENNQKEIQWI